MNSNLGLSKTFPSKRSYSAAFDYNNNTRFLKGKYAGHPTKENIIPRSYSKHSIRSIPSLVRSHSQQPYSQWTDDEHNRCRITKSNNLETSSNKRYTNFSTEENFRGCSGYRDFLIDQKDSRYFQAPSLPPQTPTHLLSFDIVNQSIEHIEMVVRYGGRSYGGVLTKSTQ